jgi:hypothetical protein
MLKKISVFGELLSPKQRKAIMGGFDAPCILWYAKTVTACKKLCATRPTYTCSFDPDSGFCEACPTFGE